MSMTLVFCAVACAAAVLDMLEKVYCVLGFRAAWRGAIVLLLTFTMLWASSVRAAS